SAVVNPLTDEIYVSGFEAGKVMVFDRTATGNLAPKRELTGANTLMVNPFELIALPERNQLIAPDESPDILLFALDATGHVAPTRPITGATTLIADTEGFAYDPVADEIFVADATNGILVFDRTSNGDVAPKRQISGNLTGFNGVDDVALAR